MEPGLAQIAITTWLPAVFAAIAGGYFAKVFLPIIYENNVRAKKLADKKIEHAENIAIQLCCYIVAWRRLIQIATLERSRNLSEAETDRKQKFVEDRNKHRDELYKHFSISPFYFGKDFCAKMKEFICWDEDIVAKRLDELPEISTWKKWEEEVLLSLRKDLNENRR
jgi:hypothetical protein